MLPGAMQRTAKGGLAGPQRCEVEEGVGFTEGTPRGLLEGIETRGSMEPIPPPQSPAAASLLTPWTACTLSYRRSEGSLYPPAMLGRRSNVVLLQRGSRSTSTCTAFGTSTLSSSCRRGRSCTLYRSSSASPDAIRRPAYITHLCARDAGYEVPRGLFSTITRKPVSPGTPLPANRAFAEPYVP